MKMKAWFTYSGSRDWWNCVMVLENGYAPFGHLCSHPNFAPGDLFFSRPDRMAAFRKLGIELDIQGTCQDIDVPADVLEKNKDESNWREMSDKLKEQLEGESQWLNK